MSYPLKPLLARALGALVLLPLLLGIGLGQPGVSGVASGSLLLLLLSILSTLPWVLAVVAFVVLCAVGPQAAWRALCFASLGSGRQRSVEELGRIAEALALAARVTLAMGLLWWAAEAVSSIVYVDAQLRGEPVTSAHPARLARGVTSLVLVPLGALLVGHLWLGQAAEAARRAGGNGSAAPLLGAWGGATVLVYLVVPVQILLAMFARFS